MSCCGANIACDVAINKSDLLGAEELAQNAHELPDGSIQYLLSIPTIKCGGCISIIEHELNQLEEVVSARVNLTLKQVCVVLINDASSPKNIISHLEIIGYPAHFLDLGIDDNSSNIESRRLLIALAVAGFAATNIMLLSVSIWSGADGTTRELFHLISALIAVPTVIFSGQTFFRSALSVLRRGQLNMDVPISLAVLLALFMSLYETFTAGQEAYFDAAVTLLFFLLIGRYLDHLMRDRARNAAMGIARYAVKGASLVEANGELTYLPVKDIEPGMTLRITAGERFAVDGIIIKGQTDCDRSFVTGESEPVQLFEGDSIEAGTLNLTGSVDINVTQNVDNSFLGEVMKMIQAAENGRGQYVRIADRLARIYAPAVHLLAVIAFIGWFITSGDWHLSIYVAISVLIITCPCALGLAVPVVHVIAAGRLFEDGILMKDGSALERLAELDMVLFDKTGTLTTGMPAIKNIRFSDTDDAAIAKTLATHSNHPASKAIYAALKTHDELTLDKLQEIPGSGIEGLYDGKKVRLGRGNWVNEICNTNHNSTHLSFAIEGATLSEIKLNETLREGSVETIKSLQDDGFEVKILSGDNAHAVDDIAQQLQIPSWHSEMRPEDKSQFIIAQQSDHRKILMVGDGLNDAPSLALAHVSMAPATASDVGRMASDFIFTRNNLTTVTNAISIAASARTLIKQNFALALGYNCIAVPLAFAGLITPLFAAIAMSASSIIVVANSMRLSRKGIKPFKHKESKVVANDNSVSVGSAV